MPREPRLRTAAATTFALVLVAAAGGGGCATMGTLQTANSLGAGAFQFAVEPAAEVVVATAAGGSGFVAFPRLDLAVRYGITDQVDISGRLGVSGLELGAKVQFTDPYNRKLVVSVAPAVGGFGFATNEGGFGVLNLTLPLLVGIGVGPHLEHQVVIAPRVADWLVFGAVTGTGAAVNALLLGGSIGFVAKLHDKFRLLPELSFMYPVLATGTVTGGGSSTEALGNGFFLQFSVGVLLFGGGGPAPKKLETDPMPPDETTPAPTVEPVSAPGDDEEEG